MITAALSFKSEESALTAENFPAGRYLVSDPCYVFTNDDLWSDICTAFYGSQDNRTSNDFVVMTYHGHNVFMFGTAHGDGVYPVRQSGSEVGLAGVDAGVLSFIPEVLVTGDTDFSVWVNISGGTPELYDSGSARFGDVDVNTQYEDEDEDEDENEDPWADEDEEE